MNLITSAIKGSMVVGKDVEISPQQPEPQDLE